MRNIVIGSSIRRTIRRHPRIRARLLPWWHRYNRLLWQTRNAITRRRPVTYSAGRSIVRLHPDGQIPEMLWTGGFESLERDFVTAFLKPGMRVVNIGANVGLYAVMASAIVGSNGEVHAFEPATETYARLLRNLDLNGSRNVVAKRVALSNGAGRLVLCADPKHPSCDGHRYVEHIDAARDSRSSDEIVECLTLDGYFTSLAPAERDVDLIIIDVEGAELAVLEGARQTLARDNTTLLLECSRRQREVEGLLRALGFRFWTWNREKHALEAASFRQITMKGDVIVRREGWSSDS